MKKIKEGTYISRYLDRKRGYQKTHTFALYDDTWKEFKELKDRYHLASNAVLEILLKTYRNSNETALALTKKMIDRDLNRKIMSFKDWSDKKK